MTLVSEITRLKPGSPALEEIRARAADGDQEALAKYAYYAAWRAIQADKTILARDKMRLFKELVKGVLIEAVLG